MYHITSLNPQSSLFNNHLSLSDSHFFLFLLYLPCQPYPTRLVPHFDYFKQIFLSIWKLNFNLPQSTIDFHAILQLQRRNQVNYRRIAQCQKLTFGQADSRFSWPVSQSVRQSVSTSVSQFRLPFQHNRSS